MAAGIVLGTLTAVTGVIEATCRLNGLMFREERSQLLHKVEARVVLAAVDAALPCRHDGHTKRFKPRYERNDCRARVEGAFVGIGRSAWVYSDSEELLAS